MIFNKMYEIKMSHEPSGNCKTDGEIKCGYCELCHYLYGARIKAQQDWTLEEWRIDNYKKCKRAIKLHAEKKAEIDREIALNCGGIKHEFWTIALPPKKGEIEAKKNYELIEAIMSKDLYGMGQSCATLESYTKEAPKGGNFHIHVLVCSHGTYKKSVKIKKLSGIMGVEPNFVDCARLDNSLFETRLKYIMGMKQKSKEEYLSKDFEWREELGVTHVINELPEKVKERFEYLIR